MVTIPDHLSRTPSQPGSNTSGKRKASGIPSPRRAAQPFYWQAERDRAQCLPSQQSGLSSPCKQQRSAASCNCDCPKLEVFLVLILSGAFLKIKTLKFKKPAMLILNLPINSMSASIVSKGFVHNNVLTMYSTT